MTNLCFGTAAGISQGTSSFLAPQKCGSKTSIKRPPSPLRTRRTGRIPMIASADASVGKLLSSEDFLDRVRGINRIDEMADVSERVSALVPIATEDPNQQVRYAAISRISNFDATALSVEDGERVLNAARFVMMNDKESSCQSAAADLIAGLKLKDGFDDLVDMFNRTSDWMLKFSIAAGLGEMGDPKAFDFLVSVLNNEQEQDFLLIAAAIGALGELGDERGIPVVERFLTNEDSSIQERAKIAHSMLTAKK